MVYVVTVWLYRYYDLMESKMGILYDCMVPSKSFTIETLFDFKRDLNKKFNNLYDKHSAKDTISSESLKNDEVLYSAVLKYVKKDVKFNEKR